MKFEFLYVIRNTSKQQKYSVILNGCGQTRLGMSKVMSNSEWASSHYELIFCMWLHT